MTLVAGQAMLTIILTPAIEWHIHKIFSHNWQLCGANVPIRSVILAKQPIYRLLYELHASNKQLLTHFGHQKCSIRPVDLIHRLQWRVEAKFDFCHLCENSLNHLAMEVI